MKLTATDSRVLTLLGVLALHVFLLVYANAPESIDGADTLDVTATWLQHGVPAATRLTTERQLIVANQEREFYTLSPDGERYSKKGVTPSLALLPFVALSQATPLSTRATAMLLNPIVTALTAVLLYLFARRLNASTYAAALLTLMYAFGTLAIVYAKTLFGEPLAALLLLAALYCCYAYRQEGRVWRVAAAGAAIGLCIGVNFSYALLTVPLGLYVLWARRDLHAAVAYALPIAAMLAFLAYWNWLRFGDPFDTGYGLAEGIEGFTTPFFYGMTGLWLSLYKGVFWFQPVLLLTLFGLPKAWRAQRALLVTGAAIVAIHTATYATWWAWDGAWSWGSRFVLPVLPLMLLPMLPVLERTREGRWLRVAVAGLFAVSVLAQIPGVLTSYIPFYETVYDGQLFRWQNNAVLAAFAGLYESPPDPAVLTEGGDLVHLAVVAGGALVGAFAAWRLCGRARYAVVGTVIAASCLVVAARQQAKPSYELVREWERVLSAGSTVYVQSFEFDTRLLDLDHMRIIVANPHAPLDEPLIQAQWERAKALSDDLWLVTWFPPASAENWAERELWRAYPFIEQTSVGGHRALHFEMALPAEFTCIANVTFDPGIRLHRYGTRLDARGVHVSLSWALPIPVPELSWFVHLIDGAGSIVRQQDRAPSGSGDYLFFPLPPGVDITGWALRVGWVNPVTGEQAAVTAEDGQTLDEPFVVLPLLCPAP